MSDKTYEVRVNETGYSFIVKLNCQAGSWGQAWILSETDEYINDEPGGMIRMQDDWDGHNNVQIHYELFGDIDEIAFYLKTLQFFLDLNITFLSEGVVPENPGITYELVESSEDK